MSNNKIQSFTINDLLVTPSHNEIILDGRIIRVQPKVMDVLYYLAQHHDRVISNEELIEQVWSGRVVTHSSVQKSINFLRKALTEVGVDSQLIAHYSKQGYQLQGQPIFLEEAPSAADGSNKPRLLSRISQYSKVATAALLIVILVVIFGANTLIQTVMDNDVHIEKAHKLGFDNTHGYTSDMGHERGSAPHPDNNHVAYIQDSATNEKSSKRLNRLAVRGSNGQDWFFATGEGTWSMLEWSPSGRYLAAIELLPQDETHTTPDFYTRPANIYTIHIFSLDFANKRLLEQHRLSQWLGAITSVAWWDESTIELVGKQGGSSAFYRYRYAPKSRQLDVLETLEFAPNPSTSHIQNKITALSNELNNQTRVDFLDEKQQLLSQWTIDSKHVELSWIPDGSGLLVHAIDKNTLFNLYRDGQVSQIPFVFNSEKVFEMPRYSADGQSIFYTEINPVGNIWLASPYDEHRLLTNNRFNNYSSRFSKNANIAYVSIRNNEHQIWLIDGKSERQLTSATTNESIKDLIWVSKDQAIVYATSSEIVLQPIIEGKNLTVTTDVSEPNLLSYSAKSGELLVSGIRAEARNIWAIDFQNGDEKQLTFGAIGSALSSAGNIYFQYANQAGLWTLNSTEKTPVMVSSTLPSNSKILDIVNQQLFYITGGACRESDVYTLDILTNSHGLYLERQNSNVITHSFRKTVGVTYTECLVPESDIVVLK